MSLGCSFFSVYCVVFFSYWRDLSKHVVLLWCLVLFCFSFLFCYNMIGVRDLFYHRIWWVWKTCQTVSVFFWCPVLFVFPFCLSFSFCYNMMSVRDLLYCRVCERSVIPCRSFSYVGSFFYLFSVQASLLLFHRIICNLVFEYICIYTNHQNT